MDIAILFLSIAKDKQRNTERNADGRTLLLAYPQKKAGVTKTKPK